jgi:hypothetical protein
MKNKMKLFATFALCFFSYKSLFAQNVNYKIVKDNPSETTILGGINYLSTDMSSSSSILMGYGAFAQFSYKKLGTITFDWRKMYMSIRDDKMFMGEGAKFYNGLDLGGSFAFYNNEASKSIPIVLSSSTSGNTVSTKYINIDGKAKTSFELRAGINTMSNAFKYKFDTIKKYSENELVMYKDTLVYENKSISGNTQRSSFYIGIAKRYVTNLECSISGSYNDYSNFNRAEKIFYADFL